MRGFGVCPCPSVAGRRSLSGWPVGGPADVHCLTRATIVESVTREKILSEYRTDDRGVVLSPGKFEGQPAWVIALWEDALDGLADVDTGEFYQFDLRKGDPLREEWPELDQWLGRGWTVRLIQDDQGFVNAY